MILLIGHLFLCEKVCVSRCFVMFSWRDLYFFIVVFRSSPGVFFSEMVQGVDGLRRASNPLPCLEHFGKERQ